jgi:hypothetical protein
MEQKEDVEIRVAHISGRYLIAATIIGGLFGLSIGFSFIVNLKLGRAKEFEVTKYIERYDREVNFPWSQEDKYNTYTFAETDITIRLIEAKYAEDSSILVQYGEQQQWMKSKDVWELDDGYRLEILKIYLRNEQQWLACRLFKNEEGTIRKLKH